MEGKCPVKRGSEPVISPSAELAPSKCPIDDDAKQIWLESAKCPVDLPGSEWASKVLVSPHFNTEAIEVSAAEPMMISSDPNLPTDRDISSIPRTSTGSNWVYPSQKQFFDAMRRKQWDPSAKDMETVVPIHNAVNERAWYHIQDWERSNLKDAELKCGGIALTSFKGSLKDMTPRALFNTYILGYKKPFDRHDWTVSRCGTDIDYVIDFYLGTGQLASFYLDVRPKLNSWEGIKLRAGRFLGLL